MSPFHLHRIVFACAVFSIATPCLAIPDFNIDKYCDKISNSVGGSYAIELQCRKGEYRARS